jgi:AraC family ethanolamine operon transcriptional activator
MHSTSLNEEQDTRHSNNIVNRRKQHIARQAMAYFEDNYAHAVRMEDVCQELGVGLRTMQRYFAAYFQMTPYHYLKSIRYNKARRCLLASDPMTHSVTGIAMDNGFYHFGRFAVEYRTMFGEMPSETLASSHHQIAVHELDQALESHS